jgi:transcriptional regulator with XRE-family HTH domain
MDTVKTGLFLKELRKERGLTQEQLGEKVGVTNKTVSRWETGNYMPPVECLSILSDLYGVSINEIVSGKRLAAEELPDAAEDNLKNALELSEQSYKKTERRLTVSMAVSTLLAVWIILLLPSDSAHMARSILLILLVVALALISNTLNIVALALNKERSGGSR